MDDGTGDNYVLEGEQGMRHLTGSRIRWGGSPFSSAPRRPSREHLTPVEGRHVYVTERTGRRGRETETRLPEDLLLLSGSFPFRGSSRSVNRHQGEELREGGISPEARWSLGPSPPSGPLVTRKSPKVRVFHLRRDPGCSENLGTSY